MGELLKNKWVKFGIVITIYLLWVIWVGNWWLLLLVPVIYDIYISKKVHWAFWKKKGVKKQSKTVEWIDALIFAVVAATLIRMFLFEAYTIPTSSMEKSMLVGDYLFVSKVAYGPKLPNTPLSVPFTHHTLPFTQNTKSYSEAIQRPYKRIAGFSEVKRNDIVVFNFPAGDTVVVGIENPDYYSQVNSAARNYRQMQLRQGNEISEGEARERVKELFHRNYDIVSRPVDKRENYIKRCIGIPGDIIESREGQIYVNGQIGENPTEMQYDYVVKTNGTPFNTSKLKKDVGLAYDDIRGFSGSDYVFPLTNEMVEKLRAFPNVVSITKTLDSGFNPEIFPYSDNYQWNVDNFGPLYIPKKGDKVDLTLENLPLYTRIIG
ncbi:MAG: signal peptidase I, partial [Odoribacter sp.]|nr:signal peptidase I [Odoribacter sp.]